MNHVAGHSDSLGNTYPSLDYPKVDRTYWLGEGDHFLVQVSEGRTTRDVRLTVASISEEGVRIRFHNGNDQEEIELK